MSEGEYQRIPFSVGHKVFDGIIMQPAYLQYMLSEDDDPRVKSHSI